MLGARSIVGTAVGSRPKLNTVSTNAVNTTAERIAVRVRNSSNKSLRATTQASFSRSSTGDRLAVRLGDLRARTPGPGAQLHEPAAMLERDVGRQLNAFVHVVRGNHNDTALPHELREQPAGEDLEQRRLPRAVGAEDGEGVSRLELEGNAVERPDRTEGVTEAFSRQHRCGRRGRSDRRV